MNNGLMAGGDVVGQPPSSGTARAFAAAGEPIPLGGGQQTAWRVGSTVFKRADTAPEVLTWLEQLLTSLDGRSDFRVAPPLRSTSGSLIVDGWTAWRYEPGQFVARRWAEIIEVSRDFHPAVAAVPRPRFLDRRDDNWAVADRVAWGEVTAENYAGVNHVAALSAALRPIEAAQQLIHGDLTGNVLFSDGLPPLVIDLSPYWRPPTMAAAIVVADALVFEGADRKLVDRMMFALPDFDQFLLRALIYRTVTDWLANRDRATTADPYRAAVDLTLSLADR
ncbi:MAG: TIGR02569 family protein [Pseudonocardiales bacterium]